MPVLLSYLILSYLIFISGLVHSSRAVLLFIPLLRKMHHSSRKGNNLFTQICPKMKREAESNSGKYQPILYKKNRGHILI